MTAPPPEPVSIEPIVAALPNPPEAKQVSPAPPPVAGSRPPAPQAKEVVPVAKQAAPPVAKETAPVAKEKKIPAAAAVAAPSSAIKDRDRPLEEDTYLEQCIMDITRQIIAMPPKNGASVTPITLAGCKLLIATWEAEAFVKGNDEYATALQRAVAARTILHVGVERHRKNEPTDLFVALEIAHLAVEQMRHEVARAKEARNIDAAVNLAATTKRLLGLIAEGEKLCK